MDKNVAKRAIKRKMKKGFIALTVVLSFLVGVSDSHADDIKRGYVVDASLAPYGSNFDSTIHSTDLIQDLTADKVNLVNLTFSNAGSTQPYDDFITSVITRLNELLPPLQANGITTMLFIATPPGGREIRGGKPREVIFDSGNEALKTAHIEAWKRIALQFNSQSKLIYCPLLEGAGTKSEVLDHLVNLVDGIHNADTTPVAMQPPIILQPPYGNLKFVRQIDLSRFGPGRYFMSANFYALFDYQHQGTAADRNKSISIAYPGGKTTKLKLSANTRVRVARARAALTKRQINYSIVGLRNNAQGLCNYTKALRKAYPAGASTEVLGALVGEYAVPNYAPGAPKFLQDINKVFTACGIWSTNHARYGDPVWDVTLLCNRKTGKCAKDPGNKRHETLKKIFESNSF